MMYKTQRKGTVDELASAQDGGWAELRLEFGEEQPEMVAKGGLGIY